MLETLKISGLPPYKSIALSSSADDAVSTANLDLVPVGDGVGVIPGQEVTIKAGQDLLLTGYVRDVSPSHDKDGRNLAVSVCSRTVDATECSCDHPTGEFLDMDIVAIAKELDTLKIGIESDGSLPKEPRHKLKPGASLFHTIEKRVRSRGALLYDTPKGRLKIATKPEGTHEGGLIFGENILNASSTMTERGRYSEVSIRGQSSDGTSKQQLRAQAKAKDNGVSRLRPKIILHEGETTVDRMKSRAKWRVKRGVGNAAAASITVTGWRDAGGKIWTRNWLVYVENDWIGIRGMMIIKSVVLNQVADDGGDGTTATLEVADPRALGGENPRGKSSEAYAAPGNTPAEIEDE